MIYFTWFISHFTFHSWWLYTKQWYYFKIISAVEIISKLLQRHWTGWKTFM